ncbi:MAG TPA: methyltransferase domain-containing protein [Armatimonadota bacterium]|nr:methyltransferase domain-containing protein [Armatimonadota bacterium]
MTLADLVNIPRPPVPWQEGDNIPWDDPAFSKRMLCEHLSQDHDAASRRKEIVDAHVAWIHTHVLRERSTRILDLGCGPGLYTSRLAKLGHTCVGVDFAPAAVAHAREEAEAESLPCEYRLGDLRTTDYGGDYGLVMQVFGEINVFAPDDARAILRKAGEALAANGTVLLEAHTFEVVERAGRAAPTWRAVKQGLFSDRPHLYLEEGFWDNQALTSTTRYIIVDAATASVTTSAISLQAYTEEGYRALLAECGFSAVEFIPSLTGEAAPESDFIVVSARR